MNKPLYHSSYGFVALINGRTMVFASEAEYEEYISGD